MKDYRRVMDLLKQLAAAFDQQDVKAQAYVRELMNHALEQEQKRLPDDMPIVMAENLELPFESEQDIELARRPKKKSSKSIVAGKPFPLPVEVVQDQGIALFADGACRGNPGPGAWAAMAQDHLGEVIFEATGVNCPSTNNKMELEGVIQGLEHIKQYCLDSRQDVRLIPVRIYSDSQYVVNGINSWLAGWKARGWRTSNNKPPENLVQWQVLDQLVACFPKLYTQWVKGHAGHPQNEYCDQLANKALDQSGF